jgi:AraC-like DNA-binding protein
MSPKRFARIVRLQTVLRRLADEPDANLAALAIDCGYSDQAHLTRELQSLAGLTPKRIATTLAEAAKRSV